MKPGDTIVVHAAAGGVGLIMCQWAKHLGATVIGVVSNEEKAALARAHGAAHTVIGHATLAAEVKRITGGAMVPVVYDSVGKDTFMASIDCLAPLGLMASYGNASGPVPPVELGLLAAKGSLYLTRPTLATYTAKRSDLERVAADLFDVVGSGAVKIQVNQTFSLKDAGAATRRWSPGRPPAARCCCRSSFRRRSPARRWHAHRASHEHALHRAMRSTASMPRSRHGRTDSAVGAEQPVEPVGHREHQQVVAPAAAADIVRAAIACRHRCR